MLILFNISALLDVQANLPETSPFFVCPNGFGEHLFQMFTVLGMYNFACHTNCGLVYSAMRKPECTAKSFCAYRDILPLLLAKAKFKS